jgi:hypothetical protein
MMVQPIVPERAKKDNRSVRWKVSGSMEIVAASPPARVGWSTTDSLEEASSVLI